MKRKSLKIYLDEVCDMLDTYGGRDKVGFCLFLFIKTMISKRKIRIEYIRRELTRRYVKQQA